jgi:hypothetical protein
LGGHVAKTARSTLSVGHLKASLPLLKFSPLLWCPGISCRLIVEWKVEVDIEAARNTLPYARPRSVLLHTETPAGWRITLSGSPANGSRKAWTRKVVLGVHQASLTIPHLGCFVKACAEDVHCFVAAVTEHLAVRIVGTLANEAWFPDFHGEKLIFHDHGWVDLGLLHLILDGIAVDDGAADGLAELDGIEFGATYGTAVCALDPRL